ncbi:MAG: YbaB/EbfC family nucleoid-associated protein [Acidobacteriota bacterium]
MPNLNKLLKQAQKMQEQVQQEMEALVVEESAGGGMVTVRMSGQKQILKVTLDPSLLVPSEKEMLEDLLVAAVNQAARKVDETLQDKLGGLGTGLGLPGM